MCLAAVVSVVQEQMGEDQADGHLLRPTVHALVVEEIFQDAGRHQTVYHSYDPLILFETSNAKRVKSEADFMIERWDGMPLAAQPSEPDLICGQEVVERAVNRTEGAGPRLIVFIGCQLRAGVIQSTISPRCPTSQRSKGRVQSYALFFVRRAL
jgi:hypothetical protein